MNEEGHYIDALPEDVLENLRESFSKSNFVKSTFQKYFLRKEGNFITYILP